MNLLVQVDKLVRLLETPTFAYLRLQVVLVTALYFLLPYTFFLFSVSKKFWFLDIGMLKLHST